jgi:Putative DNA-binding domain
MIPARLEDWSYNRIKELVDNNINESKTHDFKFDLPNSTELTKDCCAFANTDGGFIVFGVREKGHRFDIVGIDNDKEFANRFGQKINALPANPGFIVGNFISIPDSKKILAVIHIPESSYRPHIPSQKDLRIFWKRTNAGNEQMTYEEIRESFGQQSQIIDIIERRRKNRISWFAYHSLSVLDSLKKKYEELYHAIEEYQMKRNDKTKRHVVAIADTALQIGVNHTITLIQRDIQTAMDYINNTWLVAKFPDELSMIGYEFELVKNTFLSTFIYDESLLHDKQMIMEKTQRIQFYIDTIRAEEV